MRILCLVTAAALSAAASAACASKSSVRSSVGAANTRIGELVEALEDVQMRTGRHERRIAEIDGKTGRAARSAAEAREVALGAAAAARTADERLSGIERAANRLVFDVAMSADEANFGAGEAELPEAARVRIDRLVHQLIDDPADVYIEIEGHTDDRGGDASNLKLGLARGMAVKRYLYDVHQIPLHRISVISFGEQNPVAPNTSETGRARNRRVVIRVRA